MNPNVISPLPLYSSYTLIIITSVLDFYTWITHLSQKLPFNRVFIFSECLILEYSKREGSLDFTEMMLSSFSLLPNKQRAKRKAMQRKQPQNLQRHRKPFKSRWVWTSNSNKLALITFQKVKSVTKRKITSFTERLLCDLDLVQFTELTGHYILFH